MIFMVSARNEGGDNSARNVVPLARAYQKQKDLPAAGRTLQKSGHFQSNGLNMSEIELRHLRSGHEILFAHIADFELVLIAVS